MLPTNRNTAMEGDINFVTPGRGERQPGTSNALPTRSSKHLQTLTNQVPLDQGMLGHQEEQQQLMEQDVEQKPILLTKHKKKKFEKLMKSYTLKGLFESGFVEYGQTTCCICFEDYNANKVVRKVIRCGHIFHSRCLENWISRKLKDPKCPLCNLYIME